MKLLDLKKIDEARHNKVTFIRIEPIDLKVTLTEIITTLSDLSWVSHFDEDYIREAFLARAQPTIEDIKNKLLASSTDKVSSDAGEYVVSELSRCAIKDHLNYNCIPLAEIYNKQKSSNPGFDFHAENDCSTLIFGEAKYLSHQNAYGTGLKQIVEFIDEKKDLKDIPDLKSFFDNKTLKKAVDGEKGFAVGFASKTIASEDLIENILKNDDYNHLLIYEEIILVAVNV
jgi:hypothetical protein